MTPPAPPRFQVRKPFGVILSVLGFLSEVFGEKGGPPLHTDPTVVPIPITTLGWRDGEGGGKGGGVRWCGGRKGVVGWDEEWGRWVWGG